MSVKAASLSLATVFALSFVLCVLYGVLLPQFHPAGGLVFLPGFAWTAGGFAIGLVETFVYGVYGGAVFAALYNRFSRSMKTA
ncbi:MAG: DUF5676 family membrane protein [Acidobacteriota bacterium]